MLTHVEGVDRWAVAEWLRVRAARDHQSGQVGELVKFEIEFYRMRRASNRWQGNCIKDWKC
jgi:hypothetical protein